MARGLPEIAAAYVRRKDDFVAGLIMLLTPVLLNGNTDTRTLGKPMHKARTHRIGNGEKLKLLAENAVIALPCLLLTSDDSVKLGLILRHNAVDALKHLVLLVAAIVATGHTNKLHNANLARTLHVRAAAHFHIIAHGIGGDILTLWNVSKTLKLVCLPCKQSLTFRTGNDLLHERLVKRDKTANLLLNLGEIIR